MKLMRKIALVFVAVAMFSSVAYFTIGQSVVSIATERESDKGPGRTSSVINRVRSDINRNIALAKEYGQYIEILNNIEVEYGNGASQKIFDIQKNIKEASISNMFLVDDKFNLYESIVINNIDINSSEVKEILMQCKDIIKDDNKVVNRTCGGIISTEDSVNIVAMGKVSIEDRELYNIIITPLDEVYENNIKDTMNRIVTMDKVIIDEIPGEKIKTQIGGKTYYCVSNEDSIDVYTDIVTLGNGPNYMLHLKDDTGLRVTAVKTISILVILSIIVTIFSNTVSYQLVKRKVLKRILQINDIVNRVTNNTNLDIRIKDDREFDEISTLTLDLNKMFSRLKSYSDNLEYIGNHDLLTGLTDRRNIHKYICELIKNEKEFAVFFIDLDNFKGINDSLGHTAGDELLCLVTKKLVDYEKKHEGIKVGRFGGDEFILVREGINEFNSIRNVAGEILKLVNNNFEIKNYIYEIKASMGISYFPQHSKEDGNLLQYSDIAMYESKRNGGNLYTIFNDDMLEPLKIEGKLKSAIENKELEVYYQPIYSIGKNEIIGAEALIRWNSEEGIIGPDKFIPVAKKTGDIFDIDIFVLKEAMKTCKECRENLRKDFYISINASKRLLRSSELLFAIDVELKKNGLDSSAIKLEITEDEIIDDFNETIQRLNEIREMGIGVYLDDFGTGYSSFNHIKVLPVDVIKIDRSFLMDIEENNKSKSIVETMIDLCHSLNLVIVCEGVEDKEQVDILRSLECDNIQGYYFSRPLPKETFNNFIKEFKR